MIASLLLAVALASPAPHGAATVTARTGQPSSATAPVDEYFGSQKMSALGLRMKIGDLGRRYERRQIADADLLHDAALIDQSMRAWIAKYPRDPWAAPTAFHLAQLLMDPQTAAARAQAKRAFEYVVQIAPGSHEGHLARQRLHDGFPALHGETDVTSTATPTPVTTVAPSGAPAPTASSAPPAPAATRSAASASPASSPPATAAPAATPSADATPHGILTRPR